MLHCINGTLALMLCALSSSNTTRKMSLLMKNIELLLTLAPTIPIYLPLSYALVSAVLLDPKMSLGTPSSHRDEH